MLGAVLSWLTGGVLDRVLKSVDHAIDNETDRQKIRADAITRYAETAAEERADARRYRWFWYVWTLAAVGPCFWLFVVCLDTVFLFSGNIPDLPESVKPYVSQIFASLFGSGGVVAVGQALSGAIRGRK